MVNANLGEIRPVGIDQEMRSSYLDYAMSVIVSRALPDVRDGLKPVQRRILYAMHDQGMRPTSSYKKSARLVGEVLGKYHPHGDSPVYEAQVRMAQPFSLRYPLVDGQGNYGSVDGDPPAAMRYTECKLSSITEMILGDIEKNTVAWSDNFDQSLQEPSVLPARLPTLLVNGATGIAVGMATSIPPHNLTEICDAINYLIKTPNASVDDLMKYVKGPDFPTGAHIWGLQGIRDAFTTGRGRVMLQSEHQIEDVKRQDRKRLVFTEIPFQVNKATLVSRIADLIKTRKIDGVSEIRDESDRKGMRIVLEMKRGSHIPVVLNNLYKHTSLRTSFSVNMIALVNGTPRVLNLKQSLVHYVEFRQEVIRKRAEFELRKAKARLHVLEGLKTAIENLDKVIELIRASSDVEEARANLTSEFSLTDIQAQAILDMQLRRLAALERQKIETEYQELLIFIRELEDLLNDPAKVLNVIRTETNELKRKYGDERRTEIHDDELGVWRREDTEPKEEVIITLTKNGYAKRVRTDTYRRQHRGGVGKRGLRMTKEDDITPFLQVANTHDYLLFFTDRGRVFRCRVFDLPPDQSRNSRGTPVVNLGFNIETREQTHAMIAVSSLLEDIYLVMVTKKGQIKRMHLPLLRNMNRSGLKCFNLKEDDDLVGACLINADQDVVLATELGLSIRIPSADIRSTQRAAGGVKGITLTGRDQVVAMDVVDDDGFLLIVGKKGRGKLTAMRHYKTQRRGGKGLITLKVTTGKKGTGKVADAVVVSADMTEKLTTGKDDEGNVLLVTEKAQILRTSGEEIRKTGRNAQGVKIAVTAPGDNVTSIRIIEPRRQQGLEIDPSNIVESSPDENGSSDEDGSFDEDGSS
jgi:DNA gyrase subunit A